MRYGLLSDVHANLPALLAVLAEFNHRAIDAYVCAGDVVGYGPHPAECVAAVGALNPAWVLGNHELMLLGRLPLEEAPPLARKTLEWTRRTLPSETTHRLGALPLTAELPDGIVVAHGSLADPDLRIHRRPEVVAELERFRVARPHAWILVLGHTHKVMVADSRMTLRLPALRSRVRVTREQRYILNPGSVGQARGFVGHARAAVLDTTAGTLELLRVPYDKASLVRDLRSVGFPIWAHHRTPVRRMAERVKRKAFTRSAETDHGR
jgi:predicted phosphodiesterase